MADKAFALLENLGVPDDGEEYYFLKECLDSESISVDNKNAIRKILKIPTEFDVNIRLSTLKFRGTVLLFELEDSNIAIEFNFGYKRIINKQIAVVPERDVISSRVYY